MKINKTTEYRKDIKRIQKQGLDLSLLNTANNDKLVLTATRTGSHAELF
jgi:mRNA-degrading endonuclease YafQ of YafQ-DinJ toxin-antitoxin module